jgi:hypothetical protein
MVLTVTKHRWNWKKIVPLVGSGIFVILAIRKFVDQEYIHATIAAVLALFQLMLGLKGVTQVSGPLSESTSEIGDLLAGSQDGNDL